MAIPFTPLTFSNNMPSGYALDENFADIKSALQSALSREHSNDNEMKVDLDMNARRILNLPTPVDSSEAARLADVQAALSGGGANLITFDPYDFITADNVQDAIEQTADKVNANETTLTATKDTVEDATFGLNERVLYVGSVAELEALSLPVGTAVYLTEEGRAGEFVVKAGTPPSDPQNGVYITLANGNYAQRVTDGVLFPQFFGSGGGDDQVAIEACRDMCVATSSAMGLRGTYSYATAANLARDYLKIQPVGEVVFKHTGTGAAFSMDAGATSGLVFGLEMTGPIIIEGNSNSLAPMLRALIQGKIDLEARELPGTAFDVQFGVLTRYKLACSINRNPMTLTPYTGLAVKARGVNATTACIFDNVSFEGLSGTGFGVDIIEGDANLFLGGTSEGNAGGGVRVRADSPRNTFIDLFGEANGLPDWDILGSDTTLIGCTGSSAVDSLKVNAQSFLAQSCTFRQMNILGGGKVHFDNCVYLDTFSDTNKVSTWRALRIGPVSGAFFFVDDRLFLINAVSATLQNSWLNYGSGDASALFYKTGSGTVRLEGTVYNGAIGTSILTLPASYRPSATLLFACAGVSSTDVVNIEVRTTGEVIPISGAASRVGLNNIEFRHSL